MPGREDWSSQQKGFAGVGVHLRAHAVAYAALFVAITGTSYAALDPIGSDGDVDLCVKKKTGAVSVQKGAKCPKGTIPLTIDPDGLAGPAGQAGAPGQPGQPGSQGATGPKGATGPRGATGTSGQQGNQGIRGATGSQGPQGPAGAAAPVAIEPPDPYGPSGFNYRVEIDGGPQIPLTSFAGCRDKVLGLEYEDCYFELTSVRNGTGTRHAEGFFRWLSEQLAGDAFPHDFTVTEYNASENPTRRVDVQRAFITEFELEGPEATSADLGRFSFVAVPGAIQTGSGGSSATGTGTPLTWGRSDFTVDIDGVDPRAIVAVHDIKLTFRRSHPSQGSGCTARSCRATRRWTPSTSRSRATSTPRRISTSGRSRSRSAARICATGRSRGLRPISPRIALRSRSAA